MIRELSDLVLYPYLTASELKDKNLQIALNELLIRNKWNANN